VKVQWTIFIVHHNGLYNAHQAPACSNGLNNAHQAHESASESACNSGVNSAHQALGLLSQQQLHKLIYMKISTPFACYIIQLLTFSYKRRELW